MELNVLERIALSNILPDQGDVTTLKIIREFREDLSFSEDEHKELNFRQEGEKLRWADNEIIKDVQAGSKMMVIIIETLERLDGGKELPASALSLYERFVETTE